MTLEGLSRGLPARESVNMELLLEFLLPCRGTAVRVAALVPIMFILRAAPEDDGGSGVPLGETMGSGTSPVLSCDVCIPAT